MHVRADDVLEKRLIRPHRLDLAARVLHERGEQAKAGSTCGLQARRQHFAADGNRLSRLDRHDRLQPAAIFVANRKSKQQIFDGEQAGLLEIRGFPRTNALQILQGQLKDVVGHTVILLDWAQRK
jgi:hypothetical protein